jgi:cysteine-rich repeat protein
MNKRGTAGQGRSGRTGRRSEAHDHGHDHAEQASWRDGGFRGSPPHDLQAFRGVPVRRSAIRLSPRDIPHPHSDSASRAEQEAHETMPVHRRSAPPPTCGEASGARLTKLFLLMLFVLWSLFAPAETQVPGFYDQSDAGWKTACGDAFSRGGGCEVAAAFAFERHDADGDGAIDILEAPGLLEALGIEGEARGRTFHNVDSDFDGKLTLEEWESAGHTHPPIAMRVRTQSGFDRSFQVESAEFGEAFRHTLGAKYISLLSVADPIEACSTLQGLSHLYHDKIVMVKRGSCEFCIKAKMAQARGAMAVLIANEDETLIHMVPGTCGHEVEIPAVMIPHSAGNLLEMVHRNEMAEVAFPTCMEHGGAVMPGYGLETCDDGNSESGDGCNSKCILECGNRAINAQETCDDGNVNSNDGCSSACSLEPGFIDCSPSGCTSQCGDGITIGGLEGCESAGKFSLPLFRCCAHIVDHLTSCAFGLPSVVCLRTI